MAASAADSVGPLLGPLAKHSPLISQDLQEELKFGATGSKSSRSVVLDIIMRFLTHEYWLRQKQQYLMKPSELARSH